MTATCWVVNAYGDNYSRYFCATEAHFIAQGGGVTVIADGIDLFSGSWIYSASTLVNGGGSSIPTATYSSVSGNCSACPVTEPEKYDCINGACTPKTTYNTPGLYPSLSDCQVACGIGCSGKCISNSDWATIEGLSNQLKNRNCG